METLNTGDRGILKKIAIVQLAEGVALPSAYDTTTINAFIANSSGSATRVTLLTGTDNQNLSPVTSELTTEGNSEHQATDLSANLVIVGQTTTEQNALKTTFHKKSIRMIYIITDSIDTRVAEDTGVVTVQAGDTIEISHTVKASVMTNNVSAQERQTLLNYTKQIGADLDTNIVNQDIVAA